MKKAYIYLIVFIALIGIFSGIFVNNLVKSRSNKLADANFSEVTDDCIEEKERYEIAMLNLEEANASEIKLSPNASITFKIYYKDCNHTIINKEKVDSNMVNLSQDEVQSRYLDWSIEGFTQDNVTLYKEEEDFCNEHYMLKENNGYIAIYQLDENQNEILLKVTDIATRYLPEGDLQEIGDGLTVYTKQDLNKILEDYE